MAIVEFPALYHSADSASDTAQRQFFGWLGTNLIIFVLVSVISASNSSSKYVWLLCGGLLLVNFVLTLALAIFKPEQNWFAARAIAESVKTSTWRFISRAEPFDGDESVAKERFKELLKDIFYENKKFSAKFADALGGDQLPGSLLVLRRKSLDERVGLYRDVRVADQKSWYSTKSGSNRKWAKGLFGITLVAMAMATVFHFWRAADVEWKIWPGDTAITVALSLLAWLQAKRYQELAETYAVAAQDIALVEIDLQSATGEVEFGKFVADAEQAFSREHTQWVARKDK